MNVKKVKAYTNKRADVNLKYIYPNQPNQEIKLYIVIK